MIVQKLYGQVNPWRFAGENQDLFEKAKEYIVVQSEGFQNQALSYSKGLIIENRSKYNLIFKDSKCTCGKPLKPFDDVLFNNKGIPPNTAIAQYSQNHQAGNGCKYIQIFLQIKMVTFYMF